MPLPIALLALAEALATASFTTLPLLATKQSRFSGPVRLSIERAGQTGGGTAYGAYLPGPSSDVSKYQLAQGDGTTTAFATQIPYVALANNNFLVRISRSPRSGTVAVSAAGTTVTGTSTAFATELRVGDEILINGESRVVVAIASATSLTVDKAFVNAASGVTISLIDGLMAATTDFTVSNVGGFATITAGSAAKVPNGCKIEIMFVTPVTLFSFATATTIFRELELDRGVDVAWYASDATASPSATNVYLSPLGS